MAVALALFGELPRDQAPSLLLGGAGHAVRRPRGDLELGPCGAGRPAYEGGRIAGLDTRAHQADDTVVDDAAMEAALDLALSAAGRAR